ncbi:MAG: MFS transporter [Deltaproteobacteria bacterium HGW-Deltaproteobacteria-21]|nr:MAG: MFS transporter [Deltaproteobacteria bacterium HGW-Deltaproteobacteria-21]
MKRRLSKSVWGWALYDWANSAFATTVMAGFFPVFFKMYWSHGANVNESTALLGFGNSAASLLVAITAPLMGSIADRSSGKKKFLIAFAYLGALTTASLYTVGKGEWALSIFFYMLGIVGFSGANIFYDALLPGVSTEENVDFISGLGFSLGYLGGGLLFALNVLMTLFPQSFGLPDASAAVRFSFITVAVWWGGFSLFTVFWVPEDGVRILPGVSPGRSVLRQYAASFRKLKNLKAASLFLLAYWCYIDGVDTIIRMAVDYGLSIGFSSTDLIVSLLVVQFIGFPAALAFGKLGQKWGVRKAIFLAIAFYMGITLWGTMITRKEEFYVLAVGIGLVQGGIQALSRSYYCRLIPKGQSGEFFGFYNMLGKFAVIIGPALVGLVSLGARSLLLPDSPTPEEITYAARAASRWGIGSILLLFFAGGILLYFVDEEKGRADAARISAEE